MRQNTEVILRITFLLPFASVAGGNRVVAIYAQQLTEQGHDVTVVSRGERRPSTKRRFLNKLLGRSSQIDRPRTNQFDFLGEKHVVLDVDHVVRESDLPDADALIATWWRTAFPVAAMPPEKGKKFYFIQHHEVHKELPFYYSAGSYYLPLKKITISQWLVDTMADKYNDTDVDIVENSVDLEMFNAPERQKQKDPTIGLLYADTHFKGIDVSLKALEKVRAKFPNLKVVAFGTKPVSPNLPLPPGSEFHLDPAQDEIKDVYAKCDVWLCGSRAEGFHLPPSEAMACRCPVVSTRVGGAVEIVTEGVNGHIVDVEDHEALGDRLIDVLSKSSDDWKAMSDAALDRAQHYSWEDAAKKFEAILRQNCASD